MSKSKSLPRQTINQHANGVRTILTLRNREWAAWIFENGKRTEAYGKSEKQALAALQIKQANS